MRRAIALLVFVAVAGAVRVESQSAAVTVTVDANANRHGINPLVYGVAFADTAALNDLRSAGNRWGGNSTSRYNWQVNADNRANDWYYESIAYSSATAGEGPDSFINANKAGGAETMMTVPTVGWVAKVGPNRSKLASFSIAKYGPQTGNDGQWFPDAGNGVLTNGSFVTGNDPNEANVPSDGAFQQGWMHHLVGRWGSAANGGLRYYVLDNEPSIWHSTHRDVHPVGARMEEIRDKILDYGGRVKAEDPSALVVGPEEWGWSGFLFSGYDQQWGGSHGWSNLPDRAAHGNMDYLPWLLAELKNNQTATGKRVLDVFSVHYYPQGGEFGDDTGAAMQLRRNRSTRSLWDPAYTDETWIASVVRLIPRLHDWVNTYYPGTKIGITEYNWGAEGHINGATTQADVLGIFGREGLDLAARWTTPDPSTPTYKAMKLYRNYNGLGAAFGDTSVSAGVPNPDNLSAFAAQRTSDAALTIMAVNKASGTTATTFALGNFAAAGAVETWQLTSANAITHGADSAYSGGAFTRTLPAQSITLFVVHGALGPSADLAITKTDGQATATPGQLLTYTIVASSKGPDAVTGATVADNLPASLTGASWTCVGAGGGTCAANGTGSINDPTVNLPNGASVTYTLTATVSASATSLHNIATITPPSGATDPSPANNSTTDDDTLLCAGGQTVIVPDGRVTSSTIAGSTTVRFLAGVRLGNGYSFELESTTGTTTPGTVGLFAGDDGCGATSTLVWKSTAGMDPQTSTGGVRMSFTASGVDPHIRATLTNPLGTPVPFRVRLADTTMFSPAWSTNGAYNTYYSFENTTGGSVTGILKLMDIAGATIGTFTLSMPAGQAVSTNTSALAVTRSRTGTARFTHDGPPGAVLATAALANFTISPAYVQPVKFQAVRESR